MSTNKQNHSIARLIVGAMSIDGSLGKIERQKVAATLEKIGMSELVADVGLAIEEDDGTFNMFEECKTLIAQSGKDAETIAPMVFRVVTDVIAADRFVSAQEASYLSAMARKLNIPTPKATEIFKQILAERRSRLEVAASGVDEALHPQLKQLLSFEGAEDLVGRSTEGSIDELVNLAIESGGAKITITDVEQSMNVLGLPATAKLGDAETVWRETIENLNLSKLAGLGETFVTAAINRITKVNEAYKTILHFHQEMNLEGGRRK